MRSRRFAAEALGTGLLLATVIGSGIMGERLAGGNVALALLGNTLATGAMLVVLITMFGPISGAHFNPAVTAVFAWRGEITPRDSAGYAVAQIAGGIAGVLVAHGMFDESILQISTKVRSGPAQWLSEGVAAFGLAAHHPADAACQFGRCRHVGRPLHNGGLLVHRLDVLRQSCRHDRTRPVGHVCRHPPCRCSAVHCCSICWRCGCGVRQPMAGRQPGRHIAMLVPGTFSPFRAEYRMVGYAGQINLLGRWHMHNGGSYLRTRPRTLCLPNLPIEFGWCDSLCFATNSEIVTGGTAS